MSLFSRLSLIIIINIFSSISSQAKVFTTVSNGDWNSSATWDANGSPGTYWGAADEVIINHHVNYNQSAGYAGTLTINTSGSLTGPTRNLALYNGASISFAGNLEVYNFTLNSVSTGIHSGSLTISNNLTVGSGSSLTSNGSVSVGNDFSNNAGTVIFNNSFFSGGDFTNNNGEVTFNDVTSITGDFDNNNSSAVVNINDEFNVGGSVENNSSSTLNVFSGGTMNIEGDFTANSGTNVNIEGRVNTNGNFANNGGSIQNDGVVDTNGDFTQNGGSFTNDGVMLVDGSFTVNSGGTIDGEGLIRTNAITNYGSVSGDNDICALDDSSTPSQSGGGSYSAGTSICEESASAALPINLAFFKVDYYNNQIQFSWKTLSEINNDYFTIEFSSNNKSFETLLKSDGAGNSNKPINYKKFLSNPPQVEGYYRLKQVDFDGKYSYSKTVHLKRNNSEENVSVYPNPSEGSILNVELKKIDQGSYHIELLNATGNLIVSKNINPEESHSYLETEILQGRQLEKGIYFLRIQNQERRSLEKVIIQ